MNVSSACVQLCVGYDLVVVGVGGCIPCYVLGLHSKTYITFTLFPESPAHGFPKRQETHKKIDHNQTITEWEKQQIRP